MFTQASKVFLPLSGASLLLSFAYQVMTGDVLGSILFLLVGLVAAYLSLVVAGARHRDAPEPVPAAVDAGRSSPPTVVLAPGGGAWPIAAGLAITLAVGGFVLGPLASFAAMGVAAVTAVGWLGRVSAERTGRYPNLLPLGLPVLSLFAIASLMFFMSRILLAVPEQASTFIALAVAVVILAIASLIALKPNVSSRSLMTALVVGGVLMAGGGLVAGAAGQRHIEAHGEHSGRASLSIKARNVAFDLQEFDLHAEQPAVIEFENEEAQPHNVAIYFTEEFSTPVWQGDVITGPETIEYRFTAPKAGTYFFRCDIHPAMKGKVHVE